jgi:hypothetical protein
MDYVMPFADCYRDLVLFWFRLDLTSRKQSTKWFKAIVAVSIIESWLLLAVYSLLRLAVQLPHVATGPMVGFYLSLVVANSRLIKLEELEQDDKRFSALPASERRLRTGFAVVASALAFLALALARDVGRVPG